MLDSTAADQGAHRGTRENPDHQKLDQQRYCWEWPTVSAGTLGTRHRACVRRRSDGAVEFCGILDVCATATPAISPAAVRSALPPGTDFAELLRRNVVAQRAVIDGYEEITRLFR